MSIVSKAPGTEVAIAPGSGPSKRKAGPAPAMATAPRANLLPPEIGEAVRRRSVRRGLRFVVIGVVLIAALGVAGAWQLSVAAQSQLTEAQNRSQALAGEKAKYKDVAETINGITQGKAAQKVGGGTEIDWSSYLGKLQATLPSGVTLTSVNIKSADAVSTFDQSTVPLEGVRVATVTFTASSSTLPKIPDWIDGLETLPGFADASPNSVTGSDGGYTASVTMHINTGAYSNRFAPAAKEDSK